MVYHNPLMTYNWVVWSPITLFILPNQQYSPISGHILSHRNISAGSKGTICVRAKLKWADENLTSRSGNNGTSLGSPVN